MYRVYLIKNLVNNKKYVGITERTIQKRFQEHKRDSKQKDTLLYKAFRKYGSANFSIELLEDNISFEQGEERERYWIAYYDTYNHGYNMTEGGNGTVGYVFTEKIRQKMRDAWDYNKIITPERNRKLSESLKGKKFSEEHKRKLSEIAKQRVGDKNSFYNKKHKQSTKDLISIKNTKHKIAMLDPNTEEILKIFDNAKKAGIWIVEIQQRRTKVDTVRGAIVRHCIGIADCQIAYGYKWRYAE